MDLSNITENLNQIKPEDIANIKLQIQNLNDTIKGGLRSANLAEYRNTYVINAQDSLDATHPMYVHFNIINEMVKIVSIKLSFWFLNFRAYSIAAAEKEAVTSGASSETSSGASSAESSASGGGQTPTSSAFGDLLGSRTGWNAATNAWEYNAAGDWFLLLYTAATSIKNHTHTVTVAAHTHGIAHTHNIEHTHTVPAHTHDLTYGIFEEENSPTIVPSISRDNGLTYSLPIGSYSNSQEILDITRFIDTKGSKMIKFESSARARLSVQVTIKLDIKAR